VTSITLLRIDEISWGEMYVSRSKDIVGVSVVLMKDVFMFSYHLGDQIFVLVK